jgi:hypothetical protein
MKIRPVGAELFHADGCVAGRHDEANSRFSQFCERTKKGTESENWQKTESCSLILPTEWC